MDVLRFDAGVGGEDRFHDQPPGGQVVDEDRSLRRLVDDLARQDQVAHVALVGAGDLERLVEEVEDRQGAGRGALGEARGVLEGVQRRSPDRDARRLDIAARTRATRSPPR